MDQKTPWSQKLSIINPKEAHKDLKEMTVSYLTQQQELSNLKDSHKKIEEGLGLILKSRSDQLDQGILFLKEGLNIKELPLEKKIDYVHKICIQLEGQYSGRKSEGLKSLDGDDDDKVSYEDENKEIAKIKSKYADQSILLKKMDLQLESVSKEFRVQSIELKELKKTLKRKESDLNKELQEMAIEVGYYRDLYEKSKESMEGWRENNTDKLQNLIEEKDLMIKERADYKATIESLNRKIEVMKGELFKKKKAVSQNETEKFIINQQVETLKQNHQDEKRQYQVEIEDLQAENLRLKTKLEELNDDLENMDDDLSRRPSLNFGNLMDGYQEPEDLEGDTMISLNKSANANREDSLSNKGSDRRQSLSKDQIVKKLSQFLDVENGFISNPGSLEDTSSNILKEDFDAVQRKIKTLKEHKMSLQTQINEEKKNNVLLKKQIEQKDIELENLRGKLIEKSMSYSATINEMNEEMEKVFSEKRKAERELKIALAVQSQKKEKEKPNKKFFGFLK